MIEKTICSQSNNQINTGTGILPSTLFDKEKEYLKPLPNRILLESYLDETFRYTVHKHILSNIEAIKIQYRQNISENVLPYAK